MNRHVSKRVSQVSLGFFSILCLSSCASHLTQQQCASMNWYQVGYADGVAGNFQRDLNTPMQDCAKFGMTVNAPDYRKGWHAGVKEFCQPAQAEQLGSRGQTYNAVCPAEQSAAFEQAWRRGLRRFCIPSTGYNLGRQGAAFPDFCAPDQAVKFRNAYDDGMRVYTTIQKLDHDVYALNRQLDGLQRQLRDNQRQLQELQSQLNQPALSPDQRQTLRGQIHDLNDSNLQLRDQIGRLETQQIRLKQQQRDYEVR